MYQAYKMVYNKSEIEKVMFYDTLERALSIAENYALRFGNGANKINLSRRFDYCTSFNTFNKNIGREKLLLSLIDSIKFVDLELKEMEKKFNDKFFPPNMTEKEIINNLTILSTLVHYQKEKAVYEDFKKVILRITPNYSKYQGLYEIERGNNLNFLNFIYTSNSFIIFFDYQNHFISLHKKLSEFFDVNYSNQSYDYKYKQIFIDFINSSNVEEKSTIVQYVNKINSGTVQEFIEAYTGETSLCYSLNKWLRNCNFDEFEKIKYFAGPFSYSLYKYAYNNSKMKVNYSKKFYRKMVLKSKDYEKYKNNIGELICYPAFTSVSEKDMTKYSFPTPLAIGVNNLKSDDIYVVLYIEYKCNNSSYPTPCINVSYDSVNSKEKEYIFPPFSFFKIEKVENRIGKNDNPHIIYLTVPNKKVLIEFEIKNNKTINYDKNLNELYSS